MKTILTAILVAVSFAAVSQTTPTPYANPVGFKPIGGNVSTKGEWAVRNYLYGDSAVWDASAGLNVIADTAGMDTTGFMLFKLGPISGVPTGSGAATRVTYWSGANTLSSNAGFTFAGATTRLTLTGGTFPAVKISNFSIVDTASALRFKRGSIEKLRLTTSGTVVAQNIYLDDSLFIDKDLLNPSTGFFLGFDTTGSAASGYDKVYAKAGVIGTGLINQVAYWASGIQVAGNANYTFNPSTTAVAITAGTSTTPFSVTGADGDTVRVLSSRMFQTSSGLTFQEGSGDGFNFLIDGTKSRLSLNSGSTVFNADASDGVDVSFASISGTALFMDHSTSRIGINTQIPLTPLHIDANTAIAITLEDAQVDTPAAGAGTINNLPAGISGDPDGYITLVINGANVIIPFWNQ